MLSAEGKKKQISAIRESLDGALDEGLARLEGLIGEREAAFRAKLKLPPLSGDDLQGRLANARADAVMVLDRTPDERLPEALEMLARDSGDVGHVMLSGFAERYLQARPVNVAAATWSSKREDLLVKRLGEPAREASASLAALSDARAAALITKHAIHHAKEEIGSNLASAEGNR
jgi:hypothetical protein